MNEMMGYVFGNLKVTETAIRGVRRRLREQKKFNRNVLLILATITAHVLINDAEIKKLHAKIERLENEVETLKTPKGE